jgi:hypothetical protein
LFYKHHMMVLACKLGAAYPADHEIRDITDWYSWLSVSNNPNKPQYDSSDATSEASDSGFRFSSSMKVVPPTDLQVHIDIPSRQKYDKQIRSAAGIFR